MDKTEMLITEAVLGHKPDAASLPERPSGKPHGKGLGRYLLRCLLLFLAIVLLSAGAAAVYIYYNRQEIKNLFVEELNRNLNAPVSVQDIQLGMWNDFPMVSVSFKGVSGNGTWSGDREELFHAESFTLSFNLRDILHQRYIVREIVIRGGDFNLKHYGNGRYNYVIWKTAKDTLSRPVSFHLRKILLKSTLIRFRDLPANHDFQILARNLTARGDLYEKGQDFQLKGGVDIHSMKASDFVFLQNRNGTLDVRFSNNQQEKTFTIQEGRVGIENLKFSATGYVRYNKVAPDLSFEFKGFGMRMETLLSFLPAASARYLSDYNFKGDLGFTMSLKGNYTRAPLAVNARFHYTNGKVKHKPSSSVISDVKVIGSFTNGSKMKAQTCRLVLDTLFARMPSGTVAGRFSIADFQVPDIRYEGMVAADLNELQTFLKLMPEAEMEGKIKSRLVFSHTFPSLQPGTWQARDFGAAETQGYMQITDFRIAFPENLSLSSDSIYAEFSPKVVKTGYFTLKTEDAALKAKLFVENVLPYALLSGQKIYATASLQSTDMDWDKLSVLWPKEPSPKKTDTGKGAARSRDLIKDLYADVEMDFKRMSLADLNLHHFKTLLHYSYEEVVLDNLRFSTLQGTFDGTAEMRRLQDGYKVCAQGHIDRMDIGAGFRTFKNFGQSQLTYNNIGGQLTSDFRLGLFVSGAGSVVTDSLQLWAKVDISGGRLQNLESLKKISRFTGEDDLQDIRFTDLHNEIEINRGCIRIPRMQVFSSAADLSFSGTHTFANEVDYLVSVELSSILSKKRAQRIKKEEEFGVVTGPQSRVRLPLQIKGTLPHVEVRYVFSQARQGAAERLKENSRELRESLQEEFSEMRKRREARQTEQKERKRQEQGEFLIETGDADLFGKTGNPAEKADTAATKKKKYKTEDDFRIEFEDD